MEFGCSVVPDKISGARVPFAGARRQDRVKAAAAKVIRGVNLVLWRLPCACHCWSPKMKKVARRYLKAEAPFAWDGCLF